MNKYFKKKRILFFILIIGGTLLLVLLTFPKAQSPAQPLAEQGYLDLSSWDFEKYGNVRLDGEWEFYWDKLLTPNDLEQSVSIPDGYVKVPSIWNSEKDNVRFTDKGCATYRLRIMLPSDSIMYGVKTTSIRMSSRLYINGQEMGNSGNPASAVKKGYKTANVPIVISFLPRGKVLDIIIQAADYDYQEGGIVQSIYLGTKANISTLALRSLFFNIFTSTSLLITGFYYLLVYAGKRKDLSVLYYSGCTITFALTLIAYGEKTIMQLLPGIPAIAMIKAQNVFLFATTILTSLFADRVTRPLMPKWFAPIVVVVIGGFMLAFPFLPLSLSSEMQNFFLLFGLAAYMMITIYLLKALIRKRYSNLRRIELLQLLAAFILIIIFFADGIAYNNNLKNDNYLGYATLLMFIGIVSLMLSQQYKNAFYTIESMNIRLLELDKLKDEFLTNTSHELRTPLNGIINLTQSVIDKTKGYMEPLLQEDLKLVITSGRRLNNLINDILDMSCLKRGEIKLSKKSLDVRAATETVIHIMEHMKEEKDIKLLNMVPEDLPLVEADEERLLQIFFNLVGNAIKFTQTGSIILGGRPEGSHILLWVKDTGCGIPDDKQEDVFKAFFQVDSMISKETQGAGLGLSITKQLIELHGGSISVVSAPGEGSEFRFTLPISTGIMAENSSEREAPVNLVGNSEVILREHSDNKENRKYAILIADDDKTNLRALLTILDSEDYYIKSVTDGQQVLDELVKQPNYDLLILDVMMPKLTGYQVLEAVRKRLSAIELPVILLTAKGRVQDIKAGFEAGANDYIAKPFEAEEIKSRVSTMVRLKKTVNSLITAELNFLQAQIKPHFLYNALSVITSLSTREPKRAKELLIHLSDYLRGSFNFENHSGMVALSEELQTVKAYLSIEEARFEERLKVEYDVDTDVSASIPILCIQPLVENAVRHGIMQRVEGGKIMLSVKSEEDQVKIIVEDNGIGISKEKLEELLGESKTKSVGLRNIHKRMQALYGHGLEIESAPGQGTRVTISIPMRKSQEVGA